MARKVNKGGDAAVAAREVPGLSLLLLVSVMIVSSTMVVTLADSQPIPTFAIGVLSATYPNYEVYTFPEDEVDIFVAAYNNLGGLPSLGVGSTQPQNCYLNAVWNGIDQVTCTCPFSAPANEIVITAPVSGALCHGTISREQILPVTSKDGASLAFYKSTIDQTCDPMCQNHGTCSQGVCICDQGWKGSLCQTIIPPAGSSAYYFSLFWSKLYTPEKFYLTINKPCRWYVIRQVSEVPWGPYVNVQNFEMPPNELSFDVYSAETTLTMTLWIVAPNTTDICSGTSFTGSTLTVTQIEESGMQPQTLSSSFLLSLGYYTDVINASN